MPTQATILYRVNDALTALADELRVDFTDGDTRDEVLNALTHHVVEQFFPPDSDIYTVSPGAGPRHKIR